MESIDYKMAAEGRGGLLGSTHAWILSVLLVLFYAWSFNFSPNKGTLTDLSYGEETKLYMFGYGHNTLYSIWTAWGTSCRNHANKGKPPQGRMHASKVLAVLILLAGDVHLNPGPTLRELQARTVERGHGADRAAKSPPLHTPELRGAQPWHTKVLALAQNQEQPKLHCDHEEHRASEPSRPWTMDRRLTGESPRAMHLNADTETTLQTATDVRCEHTAAPRVLQQGSTNVEVGRRAGEGKRVLPHKIALPKSKRNIFSFKLSIMPGYSGIRRANQKEY